MPPLVDLDELLGAPPAPAAFSWIPAGEGPLDFRAVLGSALPRVSADEIELALADPAPLCFEAEPLLKAISRWRVEHKIKAVSLEESERTASVVDYLEQLAAAGGSSILFNASYWLDEKRRRTFWHVPGYRGRVALSNKGVDALRSAGRPMVPLQSIPKALRPAFHAPGGFEYVDVDLVAAHGAIAAALVRDAALARDVLSGEFHEATWSLFLSSDDMAYADRKKLGKAANSALLCGASELGLRLALEDLGVVHSEDQFRRRYQEWHRRYPVFAEFKRAWAARCSYASSGLRIIRPDGEAFTLSRSTMSGGDQRYEEREPGVRRAEAAVKSTMSALWRTVEGAILDRVLVVVGEMRRGGAPIRLALPMHDGALFMVAEAYAHDVARDVVKVFEQAAAGAGVAARAAHELGPSWPG